MLASVMVSMVRFGAESGVSFAANRFDGALACGRAETVPTAVNAVVVILVAVAATMATTVKALLLVQPDVMVDSSVVVGSSSFYL